MVLLPIKCWDGAVGAGAVLARARGRQVIGDGVQHPGCNKTRPGLIALVAFGACVCDVSSVQTRCEQRRRWHAAAATAAATAAGGGGGQRRRAAVERGLTDPDLAYSLQADPAQRVLEPSLFPAEVLVWRVALL